MVMEIFKKKKELKKIKELAQKIEDRRQKALVSNRFSVMATEYARQTIKGIMDKALETKDSSSLEYFYELVSDWDDYGNMPIEVGTKLNELIDNPDINVGIHRTGGYGMINFDAVYSSKQLYNIFQNGLYITGDLSSGVDHKGEAVPPNKNISPINNILEAIILGKSSYKSSTGGIITAIPSEYVTNTYTIKKGHESDIYTKVDNQWALKPEYLVGFLAQRDGICKFYTKEEILHAKENNMKK